MKKILTILLSVIMASCLCGFATMAFAADGETPVVPETKAMELGEFWGWNDNANQSCVEIGRTTALDGMTDAYGGIIFQLGDITNDLSLVKMHKATGETFNCTYAQYVTVARETLAFYFDKAPAGGWGKDTVAKGDYIEIGKGLTFTTASYGVYEVKETLYYVWNGTTFIKGNKAPITVVDINYSDNILNGYGNGTIVNMGADIGTYWQPHETNNAIALFDAEGNEVLELVETCGTSVVLNRTKRAGAVGDVVFVNAGFVWGSKQVYVPVYYQYQVLNQPYVKMDIDNLVLNAPETATVKVGAMEAVTLTAEGYTALPVKYTIENEEIATVVGKGLTAQVTGVSAGTTKLTATFAGITKTIDITVENVGAELDHITVDGKITAHKRDTALNLSTLTGTKHYSDGSTATFAVTADMLSGEHNLNEVGEYTLTVTVGEKTCQVTLEVLDMPELNVVNINGMIWGDRYAVLINFNEKVMQEGAFDKNNIDLVDIKMVDSNGDALTCDLQRRETYIFAFGAVSQVGDRITIKAGTIFGNKELKQDVTYVYAALNNPWVPYNPETHKVDTVSVTASKDWLAVGTTLNLTATLNEGAVGTVKYSSSNNDVATVNEKGVVSGVSVGEVTITAKAGGKTATIDLTITEALTMKGVEMSNVYTIWVEKGGEVIVPADFTAHVVYEDDSYSPDFAITAENFTLAAVDTSVVTPLTDSSVFVTVKGTISYEGKDYEVDINVKVYEPVEMSVKEIAIVDWFAFNVFIEYPNSSINNGNITHVSPEGNSLFKYYRADGTEVKCGTYQLSGGNIALLPSFNDGEITLENYISENYYRNGDKIVLQKGFAGYVWTGELAPTATDANALKLGTGMYVRECVLQQELTYVYNTETLLWEIYIPYDGIKAASEEVKVSLGKSVSLGVSRTPDNATTGQISYSVADETIATVNLKTGAVTGVKEGNTTVTATITGEFGEFSVVINVKVEDAITGIEFAKDTSIKVKVGAESIDFTGVKADFVYGSGKTVAVDLSKATVKGLDTAEAGKINVVVSAVGPDGATYSATVEVTVENAKKGGCGAVSLGLVSMLTVITAGAYVFLKRK